MKPWNERPTRAVPSGKRTLWSADRQRPVKAGRAPRTCRVTTITAVKRCDRRRALRAHDERADRCPPGVQKTGPKVRPQRVRSSIEGSHNRRDAAFRISSVKMSLNLPGNARSSWKSFSAIGNCWTLRLGINRSADQNHGGGEPHPGHERDHCAK